MGLPIAIFYLCCAKGCSCGPSVRSLRVTVWLVSSIKLSALCKLPTLDEETSSSQAYPTCCVVPCTFERMQRTGLSLPLVCSAFTFP